MQRHFFECFFFAKVVHDGHRFFLFSFFPFSFFPFFLFLEKKSKKNFLKKKMQTTN